MNIENLQSRIEALCTQATSSIVRGGAERRRGDPHTLVETLEEMARITEGLLVANAETEQHLAIQYAVMRALAESIGTAEAYDKVLQAICEVIDGELGLLWIFDRDTHLLRVESIWQAAEKAGDKLARASKKLTLAPGQGLLGSVYLTNKPVWIRDVSNYDDFHPMRKEAVHGSKLQNALLFPLRKEGEVLGVIECFSREAQQLGPVLIEMLDALGNQIGGFMERKHSEDLLAKRVHQQSIVAAIGQHALEGVELQELLDNVSRLVAITMSVDFSKILELTREEGRLFLRAGLGWKEGLVGKTYVDNGPRSQGGYALSTNSPVIVTDLSKETRFQPSTILVEHQIVSGMSVVIPGRGHHRPFGILSVHSTKYHTFTEDDIHFLQSAAHVLSAAIERQAAEEALRLSRNEIAVILGSIADGVTAQDPSGKLIYANDAAAHIVGYASAEEFLNAPLDRTVSKFEMFDEHGAALTADRFPGRQALRGEYSAPLMIRFKVLETGQERWSVVKAQPVVNEEAQTIMAVNIFQDVTELKHAELAQRLLAEAGSILDSSLDYETRLTDLARVVVPGLADWCTVDILDENRILRRVAVAHVDPDKIKWAHEVHRRYPPDPNTATGSYGVIRTQQAQCTPIITPEMLGAINDAGYKEIIQKLGLSSIMQVPLFARGDAMGVITFIWAESGHHYTPADLALAEELGRRAALALDNARLYADAQRWNTELEERIDKRTTQLQNSNLRLKGEIKIRKQAEKQIRSLNAGLEGRVIERTRQLEDTNQELQQQVLEREQADDALQLSLKKTRELYEISQKISLVRSSNELLKVLLSSSYLQSATIASVLIFDKAWPEGGDPPVYCILLAGWSKNNATPLPIGAEFKMSEYGVAEFYSPYEPFVVDDVHSDPRVPETTRQNLLEAGVVSNAVFPLIAGGERYGMLVVNFGQVGIFHVEDIHYLRGLIDQTAMTIYNFRLLQAEARARQEAEEANNLKLKFLAMISHELRTPLTSIKGFATTLLADDVEWQPENQRDFIETIDLEADKLADLIEQLLDLSRLEAGTMRIVTQRVTWTKILSTAMAQLLTLTVGHQLTIEEEPDLPALKVDVIRVPQVITNLVSNSVKYSPSHSKITVSTTKLSDRFIKVSVLDQGQGIPTEERHRVFEAFQQLEQEKGPTKGAGLGLAICRGLIEAHGGRIWVDEHNGSGTTISFTLPVY